MLADLRYIHEKYGSHPAIWRQGPDALPLVFLYDVSFEHAGVDAESRARMQGMWAHTVKSLRGSDADAVLYSLYLDRRDADFIRDVGFDGGYTYFGASGFTEGSTPSHWPDAHERLRSDGKHFVISARRDRAEIGARDRCPRSVPEIAPRSRRVGRSAARAGEPRVQRHADPAVEPSKRAAAPLGPLLRFDVASGERRTAARHLDHVVQRVGRGDADRGGRGARRTR